MTSLYDFFFYYYNKEGHEFLSNPEMATTVRFRFKTFLLFSKKRLRIQVGCRLIYTRVFFIVFASSSAIYLKKKTWGFFFIVVSHTVNLLKKLQFLF